VRMHTPPPEEATTSPAPAVLDLREPAGSRPRPGRFASPLAHVRRRE
jgi:hypothetical protein